jgi:hypothetical protein
VSTQNVGVSLFGASNTTWSETGINWNTKPASGTSALGTATVSGTTGKWYEFNVGTYLQQQKAAGATAVTFVLKATGTTDAQALFNSDENAVNKPELLVRHAVEQALVVAPSQLGVPEGNSLSFSVSLAKEPSADVVVTITRQSGDTSLAASPASITFTAADWNIQRPVTISAAQDVDTTNGSAVFSVSADGIATKIVTATEQDDDVPAGPVLVRTSADTFVRDGSYAGTNLGPTRSYSSSRRGRVGTARHTCGSICRNSPR